MQLSTGRIRVFLALFVIGFAFPPDEARAQFSLVSVATDGTLANDDSESPALSADGRFVAFSSRATNLVANDANCRTLGTWRRASACGTCGSHRRRRSSGNTSCRRCIG